MNSLVSIKRATIDFFECFYRIKSEEDAVYWSGFSCTPEYDNLKEWFLNQINSDNRIIFKIRYLDKDVGYICRYM